MKTNAIKIYEKYYIDRDYEQVDLFRLLKQTFEIERAIYPGCYVHISPAFIYSSVVFIDSDKKAKRFFSDDSVIEYISKKKEYSDRPQISFYAVDYREPIDDLKEKFDLMISQYAGFISDCCKEYLKIGGYLLANNSHGDAGLAAIDDDYMLIAVAKKANGRYRISYSNIDDYFNPKKHRVVTKEYLYKTGKGIGYSKTAPLYVFQRIS